MKRSDFYYDLPKSLIAQNPLNERTASRLLSLQVKMGSDGLPDDQSAAQINHGAFTDLLHLIQPQDCLIFNDTRVMRARLHGHKETGGKVEVLIERFVSNDHAIVQIRASHAPASGARLLLANALWVQVLHRDGGFFMIVGKDLREKLQDYGEIPLPPYIGRTAKVDDEARYQTVYARELGAVAAPTAGLHFNEPFIASLRDKGIETAFVTLHVGAGTFVPMRCDDVREHSMHAEWVAVDENCVEVIKRTKRRGGRVIAVGTTVVRSLESAAQSSGECQPFTGDTSLFIYPGYAFKGVDAMITNFHLPESTLLVLVSAFAGKEAIRQAYAQAIARSYRFYSYGDAMFITRDAIGG